MDELFQRRVILVTGKGGVGRTTMTGAIALAAARRGLRVIITEQSDPDTEYTPLARLFGRDTLPIHPIELAPGVRGCMLFAKHGHEKFFVRVLPIPPLVHAAMNSGPLRKMLEAAPSLTELGLFYHLMTLIHAERSRGEPEHELIIVDMPASGHTLGLTGIPERLLEVMPKGPIATTMREAQQLLYDPDFLAAWVVTLPELLPVTEALELIDGLQRDRLPIGGVLLNRWLEDVLAPEERAALDRSLATRQVYGKARFAGTPHCEEALGRLRNNTHFPVLRVPERVEQGRNLLERLADTLDSPTPAAQVAR